MLGNFVFILQVSRKKPVKEWKHGAGEFPVRFVSGEDLSGCRAKNCLDGTSRGQRKTNKNAVTVFQMR